MIDQKDREILFHLRTDARKKVTKIAKEVSLPTTTVYDRIRAHHKKGFVKRSVALLDFNKLGYPITALIALKTNNSTKRDLENFLTNHSCVNSMYKINLGYDFFVEAVFEDMAKLHEFVDSVETNYNASNTHIYTIINELKKEVFLPKNEPR